MRPAILIRFFLIVGMLAGGFAASANPCPDQPVHTYGLGGFASGRSESVGYGAGSGTVAVTDTSTADCYPADGVPFDYDGDYDSGVGGAFFGYGAWADDADCAYALNVHGPNVVANDALHQGDVWFVVGEDDQTGPAKVRDSQTGVTVCEVDGSINPCPDNNPALCGPTDDPDDCLTRPFQGKGATCGSGGGDGGYWVFLSGVFADETGLGNPPTAGTITAF